MTGSGQPEHPQPTRPAAAALAAGDLAAFYEEGYSVSDPAEGERLGRWRALGAAGKTEHVVELLARAHRLPVGSLVEVGCGDGAVLEQLARRRVADRVSGFEPAAPAVELARSRAIPRVDRVERFDGVRLPAPDDAFDLAVLSHVLEHVPDPGALLSEAARVAPLVLVEVPLERNRSARRPGKRALAEAAGHIQQFDRAAVQALADGSKLRIVADLTDPLPRSHHCFFATDRRAQVAGTAKWLVRATTHAVSARVAARLFTVHYAALLAR